MNKIRVGIVGIGNMGSAHARNIGMGKIAGMKLVAICDNSPKRLQQLQSLLPENVFPPPEVKCYDSFKEMVDSKTIDAVIICTPHYFHPEMAIYAFEKGLHVLSEKPAGVFTLQVEEMNAAAKKSGKVFGIMFNQRTNPLFSATRELMANGRLGELKRFNWIITNWFRTQYYYDTGAWRATWAGEGGGVLLNQCPHNLDIWQWITGMPSKITANCYESKFHTIEVEDDATIFAEYENGATGVFISTTGETPGTNRLEITGDKGKVVLEDGVMKLWESETPTSEYIVSSKEAFGKPEMKYSEMKQESEGEAHNGILKNFAAAVLSGEPLLAPGEEGIKSLTISNAAFLSSWTGKPVTLPIDGELFLKLLNEKRKTSKHKETEAVISNLSGTYNDRWKTRW